MVRWTITVLAILVAAIVAAPAWSQSQRVLPYAEAVQQSIDSDGKIPLVVFVSSKSCIPCTAAWRDHFQPAIDRGLMRGIAIAKVSIDDSPELATKMAITTVPTVVGYRLREGQWTKYTIRGAGIAAQLPEFLRVLRN